MPTALSSYFRGGTQHAPQRTSVVIIHPFAPPNQQASLPYLLQTGQLEVSQPGGQPGCLLARTHDSGGQGTCGMDWLCVCVCVCQKFLLHCMLRLATFVQSCCRVGVHSSTAAAWQPPSAAARPQLRFLALSAQACWLLFGCRCAERRFHKHVKRKAAKVKTRLTKLTVASIHPRDARQRNCRCNTARMDAIGGQ